MIMEIKVKLEERETEAMIIICKEYINHVKKQETSETTELINSILTSCLTKFESSIDKSKKSKFFNLV
jgi:hypothetical protein